MALKKRQAETAPRAGQAKKPKPAAKGDDKLKAVSQALLEAETLPKEVRSMLSAILPHCLGPPAGDRTRSQQQGVEMIGTALGGIESEMLERVEEAQRRVHRLDAEERALRAAEGEAHVLLEATEKESKADVTATARAGAAEPSLEGSARPPQEAESATASLEADLRAVAEPDGSGEVGLGAVAEAPRHHDAVVQGSETKNKVREEALSLASAELHECEAALRVAGAAVETLALELAKAASALEEQKALLAAFRQSPLAMFKELQGQPDVEDRKSAASGIDITALEQVAPIGA